MLILNFSFYNVKKRVSNKSKKGKKKVMFYFLGLETRKKDEKTNSTPKEQTTRAINDLGTRAWFGRKFLKFR